MTTDTTPLSREELEAYLSGRHAKISFEAKAVRTALHWSERAREAEELAIDNQCGRSWKSQCLEEETRHAETVRKLESRIAALEKALEEIKQIAGGDIDHGCYDTVFDAIIDRARAALAKEQSRG